MSLQYIIDGYNLIHHPLFLNSSPKREDIRISLLAYLAQQGPCGSLKNKVTVVFDGFPPQKGVHWPNSDLGQVPERTEVIFSRSISADEKIKKLVEESGNRKTIIVVSDDREIQRTVKSLGAKVQGIEEFLSVQENPLSRKKEVDKPELTYTQMQEINRELRQLWLKQDG